VVARLSLTACVFTTGSCDDGSAAGDPCDHAAPETSDETVSLVSSDEESLRHEPTAALPAVTESAVDPPGAVIEEVPEDQVAATADVSEGHDSVVHQPALEAADRMFMSFPDLVASTSDKFCKMVVTVLGPLYRASSPALKARALESGIDPSEVSPTRKTPRQTKNAALSMAIVLSADDDGLTLTDRVLHTIAEYACDLRAMQPKTIRELVTVSVDRFNAGLPPAADTLDVRWVSAALKDGNSNWWTDCTLLLMTAKYSLPSLDFHRRRHDLMLPIDPKTPWTLGSITAVRNSRTP
jgi:hypothetical protein